MKPPNPRPQPPMRLLIGTRNAGKQREVHALFAGSPFEPVFPDALGLGPEAAEVALESGDSYVAHAVAKARYFARRANLPAAADDSGIEVDALGGAPGVHSALFAGQRGKGKGEWAVEEANNALLLERLRDVPPERRGARYRCVVAYVAEPDVEPVIVEGLCEGRILAEPRGAGGFGYDPLFWSPELRLSFGEAPPGAKDVVSHRGRAFRALIEVLRRLER